MTNFKMVSGWEKNIEEAKAQLLEQLAQQVEDEAAERVPVLTGNLRDTLFHQVEGDKAIVGATAEYAADVELGTSQQAAQPYLRPALFQTRSN